MKFAVATAAAWMAICSSAAWADEISFPAGPLRRGETVAAIYHLDRPATGTGELQVLWTDAIGRLVERRTLPFKLDHADTISIPLDLRRAVAIGNRLRVHLTLDGRAGDGAPDHRDDNLRVPFLVPRERGWSDYRAIIWQDRTAAQYAAFRDIGVTAAMVHGNVDGGWTDQRLRQTLAPLLQADLQFFVENIATDFYSSYHKWHSDGRPKNVLFRAAKQAYQQNPLGPAALWRDPSLSDPAWLKRVEDRLSLTVQQFHPYQPLFFNLADEAGIADTASFWDFDFSPASLAGMRAWLKMQ